MWLSDKWNDYELIDCGRGEKLERWGEQLLVRPDPQAIWNTPRTHPGWKKNAGRYARSSTGKAIFSFVSAIHPQRPTRPPRPQ